MEGLMHNRVVLVTGAGQGSGRGVALAFAAEGAAVSLIGRTASKLDAVAEEIRALGSDALVVPGDVSDPAQIDDAVDRTVERFGRIDVLVNTAHSTTRQGRLLKMDDDEIEALWTSGPRATLRFMRRCHPHLVGGGCIINFGSGTQ